MKFLNCHHANHRQPHQPVLSVEASNQGSSAPVAVGQPAAQDQFPPNITLPPPQIRPPHAQPMQHATVSKFFDSSVFLICLVCVTR